MFSCHLFGPSCSENWGNYETIKFFILLLFFFLSIYFKKEEWTLRNPVLVKDPPCACVIVRMRRLWSDPMWVFYFIFNFLILNIDFLKGSIKEHRKWRLPMSASMRASQSKNCPRWCMTTMRQEQRTNGLWQKTEMHSREFCEIFISFFFFS